jgi:hypothetical protein
MRVRVEWGYGIFIGEEDGAKLRKLLKRDECSCVL